MTRPARRRTAPSCARRSPGRPRSRTAATCPARSPTAGAPAPGPPRTPAFTARTARRVVRSEPSEPQSPQLVVRDVGPELAAATSRSTPRASAGTHRSVARARRGPVEPAAGVAGGRHSAPTVWCETARPARRRRDKDPVRSNASNISMISSADFTCVPPRGRRRISTASAPEEGPQPREAVRPTNVVSGRSHDRQWATFMTATGQLNGRLRAVSRGRCQSGNPAFFRSVLLRHPNSSFRCGEANVRPPAVPWSARPSTWRAAVSRMDSGAEGDRGWVDRSGGPPLGFIALVLVVGLAYVVAWLGGGVRRPAYRTRRGASRAVLTCQY